MPSITPLLFAAALPLSLLGRAAQAPAADKPNFLVILADDLGYSDLGCYGGEIHTPNLDALAANGLRFTQFYNTARCWPSRAAIMTGYFAQQVNRDGFKDQPGAAKGIRPVWAPLAPEFLRPAGYRSYHSGKWHIDGDVLAGGFDHSYCLNDHNRFFNPENHTFDDKPLPAIPPGTNYYTTTDIAQHAIDMLKGHQQEHAQQPFFVYLCFTSPHFPIQAPASDVAKYKDTYREGWDVIRDRRWHRQQELGITSAALSPLQTETIPDWNLAEAELKKQVGPQEVAHAFPWKQLTAEQQAFQAQKMAVHAAMVDRMDQEIGRVLDQVRAMQALDNTVVMFLSDNGASAEQIIRGDGHDPAAPVGSARTFLGVGPGWSTAANTPFRLHKSWVHEGGISTPFIISWPQGLKARGELRTNPAHIVDVTPTLIDIAGVKKPAEWKGTPIPEAPGRSLVPAFTKDGSVKHEYLWWYHIGNKAIRVGDWKLVAKGEDAPWELYDLSTDRSELNDLSRSYPDKAKELAQAWTARANEFKAMVPPNPPNPKSPGKANPGKGAKKPAAAK